MRGVLVLGVVALAVAGASAGSAKRDTLVPAGFAFWDRSHGLGWFDPAFRSGRPVLARTEDGGRTWRSVYRPRSVSGIAVSDGNDAWLAEGDCDFWPACRPRLLRSDDGGLNWRPLGKAVLGMTFPTDEVGFGVLYDRDERWSLMRTEDGGRSWSPFRSPCQHARRSYAWFATTVDGWVLCTGIPGAGSQLKGVFRTRDGGRSWRLVMSTGWKRLGASTPRAIPSAGYASGIAFAGGRGWVWQFRFGSYASPDGGRTWTPIAFTRPEEIEIWDVAPVSRRVAFVLVFRGWKRRELRRTDDGGRTWQIVHVWRYD